MKLVCDFTFDLHCERRNSSFREALGLKTPYRGGPSAKITLMAGTILKVDRIYIRKNAGDFDSVTFNIQKGEGGAKVGDKEFDFKKKGGRFWVKLNEVNGMIINLGVEK
jgi:hypothetical protein